MIQGSERTQIRIRQSRASSAVGMVFCCVFVVVGLTLTGTFGAFALIFVAMGAIGFVVSAINVFSERGIAEKVIDVESAPGSSVGGDESAATNSAAARLEQLGELRARGLISEGEFRSKREEILRQV